MSDMEMFWRVTEARSPLPITAFECQDDLQKGRKPIAITPPTGTEDRGRKPIDITPAKPNTGQSGGSTSGTSGGSSTTDSPKK